MYERGDYKVFPANKNFLHYKRIQIAEYVNFFHYNT
jgi:hypothetical protein